MRDLGLYKIAQRYVEMFPDKMTWEKAEEMLGVIELIEDSYDVAFASYFNIDCMTPVVPDTGLTLVIYEGRGRPTKPLKWQTSTFEAAFDNISGLIYTFLSGDDKPTKMVKPDKMDHELRRIKMINQLKGNTPPIKLENVPQTFVLDALWRNILI